MVADNKFKTVNIKGKEYVEVNERVKHFREEYPDWCIETEMLSNDGGVCVFKATIKDENGVAKAVGHAYEKESSSFINKTSYIENCVPTSSQILTRGGWKYYYQLKEGEYVLSLNMDSKKIEYCKLVRTNVYKDKPLVNLSSSRFNVTCTPQHKWVAKTQTVELEKISTEDLTNSWKIIQAVRQFEEPKGSIRGRRLGWLMCDCDMKFYDGMAGTAYICQSKWIEDIEELFGKGKKTKKHNEEWMDNYEWIIPSEEVRNILGYFGMASYKDLSQAMLVADIEDVAGCYISMIRADGEARGFSSTYPELIDAMQIMCARLGIATTFVTSRMMEKSTKPIYTLGIKKTDGAWFSELVIKKLPPQDVWCPTTENGTWIMKQNGFVTLTSNCETSAVGRALGFLGIGIDVSIASSDEVANAMKNQSAPKAGKIDFKAIREKLTEIDDVDELNKYWFSLKLTEKQANVLKPDFAERKVKIGVGA